MVWPPRRHRRVRVVAPDGGGTTPSRSPAAWRRCLGALVAFLVFNAHPASIFIGDTGKSVHRTGASAAVSVVAGNSAGPRELLSVVAAPVMVLFIPIFDTAFVVVARVLSGRQRKRRRDHSSHRLVAMGLSEPAAVAVLWVLAAISGLIGVGVRVVSTPFAGVIAGVFVIGMALFAAYLAGVRVYEDAPAVQAGGSRQSSSTSCTSAGCSRCCST